MYGFPVLNAEHRKGPQVILPKLVLRGRTSSKAGVPRTWPMKLANARRWSAAAMIAKPRGPRGMGGRGTSSETALGKGRSTGQGLRIM